MLLNSVSFVLLNVIIFFMLFKLCSEMLRNRLYYSDIDECTFANPCHVDANCTDTFGSFNCSCNLGFTGDGLNCTDIDECEMGFHDCHVHGTCVNTDGSFNCLCGKLPLHRNSAVWYNEVPGTGNRNCTPCKNISGIPRSLLPESH